VYADSSSDDETFELIFFVKKKYERGRRLKVKIRILFTETSHALTIRQMTFVLFK
jgi:hypothetical protein